ncbi:MAG: hypothetical protein IJ558_04870 [Treponema sp.]|nr:hypothetical protein [Treponema sp.]
MGMKSIARIDDLDPADFVVKWRMTEICNLRCSYCIHASKREMLDSPKRLEKLKAQEERLCAVAREINRLLDSTDFENVKLDLIGGEVSLLDLKEILGNIQSDKIKKIQITTNMSAAADYYLGLLDFLHSRNVRLSITASFHYEFLDSDGYFEKIKALDGKADILVCEMVSNAGNQELCTEFIEKCHSMGVCYMVEADLRRSQEAARRSGLITAGEKPDKGLPRYRAVFTDGSETLYKTRNMLLCDNGIEENRNQKFIHTRGFVCSNGWDFVYIDPDGFAHGRTDTSDSCTNRIAIEDFRLVEPRKCPHDNCTLCGHMSIWRQGDDE